jgi:hypothetical protein
MGPQLVAIPTHLRGINYKFVRDNMTTIMSEMMNHVTRSLVKPFQQLYRAFMDFVVGYSMCVGTYSTIFSFHKNTLLSMLDDPRGASQLFQNMMSILSTLPDMIEKSTALKNAMISFSEEVATIAGNTNTEGIISNIASIRKEISTLQKEHDSLVKHTIEHRAILAQLNGTSVTVEAVKSALTMRLNSERSSLDKAVQQLQRARDEHGQKIEGKNSRSFLSSILSSDITNTTGLQKLLQDKCDHIQQSIELLSVRIAATEADRTKQRTWAEINLSMLENKKKNNETTMAMRSDGLAKFESELMEARLITSGCSRQQSTDVTNTLKVIVPLFTKVAETSATVSCFYRVTGKLF